MLCTSTCTCRDIIKSKPIFETFSISEEEPQQILNYFKNNKSDPFCTSNNFNNFYNLQKINNKYLICHSCKILSKVLKNKNNIWSAPDGSCYIIINSNFISNTSNFIKINNKVIVNNFIYEVMMMSIINKIFKSVNLNNFHQKNLGFFDCNFSFFYLKEILDMETYNFQNIEEFCINKRSKKDIFNILKQLILIFFILGNINFFMGDFNMMNMLIKPVPFRYKKNKWNIQSSFKVIFPLNHSSSFSWENIMYTTRLQFNKYHDSFHKPKFIFINDDKYLIFEKNHINYYSENNLNKILNYYRVIISLLLNKNFFYSFFKLKNSIKLWSKIWLEYDGNKLHNILDITHRYDDINYTVDELLDNRNILCDDTKLEKIFRKKLYKI